MGLFLLELIESELELRLFPTLGDGLEEPSATPVHLGIPYLDRIGKFIFRFPEDPMTQ
jgi:hypothetical protein